MASRNENTLKEFMSGKFLTDHPIAQALQVMNQLIARATALTTRGAIDQSKEEAQPMVKYAEKQVAPAGNGVVAAAEELPMIKSLGKMSKDAKQMLSGQGAPQARPPISSILVPNPSTRATFGQ
jgi:hypothetical protein